jgi:hypothetical protein
MIENTLFMRVREKRVLNGVQMEYGGALNPEKLRPHTIASKNASGTPTFGLIWGPSGISFGAIFGSVLDRI